MIINHLNTVKIKLIKLGSLYIKFQNQNICYQTKIINAEKWKTNFSELFNTKLQAVETETTMDFNFAVLKFKHTIKKK